MYGHWIIFDDGGDCAGVIALNIRECEIFKSQLPEGWSIMARWADPKYSANDPNRGQTPIPWGLNRSEI